MSQVMLLAFALAISPNPHRVRLTGVALATGVVSYLMSSQALGYFNVYPGRWLALPADAVPPLLFMFTWYMFEDDRKLPKTIWLIAATYFAIASWIGLSGSGDRETHTIFLLAPLQLIKLGFAFGAIFVVWRGRKNDVIESRLKLRRVFAAGIGVIVAAVVATELVTGWQVPDVIELIGMVVLFGATLVMNLAFLRLNPTFALGNMQRLPKSSTEKNPLVDRLTKLMSESQPYTNQDLRIKDLAESLKVPEYQLRRTINQNLGYRNFNQFINRYRVEDATQRLVNEPRTPVLTIALDVGFRSISSFNAAFQTRHKMAPTHYRKTRLTDS